MKLAELIISEARERGVRHFFGIPGGGCPLDLMEYGRQMEVEFVSVAGAAGDFHTAVATHIGVGPEFTTLVAGNDDRIVEDA